MELKLAHVLIRTHDTMGRIVKALLSKTVTDLTAQCLEAGVTGDDVPSLAIRMALLDSQNGDVSILNHLLAEPLVLDQT